VLRDTLAHDGFGRGHVGQLHVQRFVPGDGLVHFDRDGNIRANDTRTYDAATQRLTHFKFQRYVYDNAGNQITDSTTGLGSGKWNYTYDALDRLIEVRYDGTLIARYGYDALGRRIAKRVYNAGPFGAATGLTRMIYRGGQVLAESDSGGSLTMAYTWGLGTDNLVGIHKYGSGSGDWYATTDVLRSVRTISKRDGTWNVSWRYGIYGTVIDSNGTAPFPLRYRWTGREFDYESGLYFHRSRSYSPAQARFLQEDPSGWSGGGNLYAYADGAPAGARDPDGLSADYDMQPRPLHDQLPCMGTTQGCSGVGGWTRGESWGGGAGTGRLSMAWATLTSFEKTSTGDMRFTRMGEDGSEVDDPEARRAYLELKRAAYESDDASLVWMLGKAERMGVWVLGMYQQLATAASCRLACAPEGTRNVGYYGPGLASRGIPLAVALAHEVGHVVDRSWRNPFTSYGAVMNDPGSERASMHYDNAARAALGCRSRGYDYDRMPPC